MNKKESQLSENHQSPYFYKSIQFYKIQKSVSVDHTLAIQNQTTKEQDPHHYNNYRQYVCSLIGFAVGFGSFWRFPYLIYKNGGGAFLILYFAAIFLLGIPLLYLETVIGQFHGCSLPFIFGKINKGLKFLGLTFVILSLHNSGYYNIIFVYCYRYLISSFDPNLPLNNQSIMSNAYFNQTVLHKSASIQQFGSFHFLLFALFSLSMFVCYCIVKNGVKYSGRIIIFTAFTPYVFLILLFIRGIFLQGAVQGIKYLFIPSFSSLFTYKIWVDAFVQVFYQISIATGTVVHLSSMKSKRQQFISSVYIIPLCFVICGLLCAINVFMYLGNFCFQAEIQIQNISLSGPQLSFNVFPKALAILPLANLWIFIFFASMVFLGIDTQFGFLETIYCYIKDQFKFNKIRKVLGIQINEQMCKIASIGLIFLMAPSLTSSAGIYYMQFYDFFTNSIPISVGVLIELYVFVYIVPFQELQNQIRNFTNARTPQWIRYLLQSRFLIIALSTNLCLALIDQVRLDINNLDMLNKSLFRWIISIYPFVLAYLYYKMYGDQRWSYSFHQFNKIQQIKLNQLDQINQLEQLHQLKQFQQLKQLNKQLDSKQLCLLRN